MKSDAPKVLHPLYGRPMLRHVLDAAMGTGPEKTVVVINGRDAGKVREALKSDHVLFAVQGKPMGTADALSCGMKALGGFPGTALVLNGDMPLVTAKTLRRFLGLHRRRRNALSIASFIADDPGPYGRILRDERGKAIRIVEAGDASEDERAVKEVNSGLYAIERPALALLKKIRPNRKKKEYYLTDIFGLALGRGLKAEVHPAGDEGEFLGVNTRQELMQAHEALRKRHISLCLEKGVNFIDAGSVFIHPTASIGRETLIYPEVYLEGKTKIGKNCVIYPNVRVVDSSIGDRAVIKDSTLIEGSVIGRGAEVGPFAHIRPGSAVGPGAKIGNFVEVKKSSIGPLTKAMHLSYIGDATVGRGVNIGAGAITCNYDGKRKQRTVIESNVFVGSDSQLIAPVRIGRGSYIGAGSTITGDVPAGSLALSRVRQKTLKGWAKHRQALPKKEPV